MAEIYIGEEDYRSFEDKTFGDYLEQRYPELYAKALAVKFASEKKDLSARIPGPGKIEVLTFETEEGREIFWHSSAHILAQAIKRLYPDAKFDDGPALKHGPGHFFYDIYLEHKISEDDFPRIEEEIAKIVKEDLPLKRRTMSRQEALAYFQQKGEIFKVDILKRLSDNTEISLYRQGEFEDLCRGPHIPSTGKAGVFKLTAVSGAYWKGDAANPMLQRVYGVSFPTQEELEKYLAKLEEARKRDHRKLGQELKLFLFVEEGPGFPFYLPRGTVLFNTLCEYIREECVKRGYVEIRTPIMLSQDLWVRSGHYENYREHMYFSEVEKKGFAIKPMNCPGSILVYQSELRSYRDLPLRQAELGLVHRHELSGVLHGLFRVRSFTQDDAHIYCTYEQLEGEIEKAISFTKEVYERFGFKNILVYLATRPEKSMGSEEAWQKATQALIKALAKTGTAYQVKEGEGAFYGPKIEFNIEDALERHWQCGTIQVDFNLPERFALEYIGPDGKKHQPVMIHRAILGSLERFMAILLEHYNGKLPLWLSPVQVKILTISQEQLVYAQEVLQELRKAEIRCELDDSNEKISYKIRQWNAEKINYAVIIGRKEAAEKLISVRSRGHQETETMPLEQFLEKLRAEIAQKNCVN
ncbi:MAG: threonine--tRNA ligase [Leptospiraceae bacterium]|nr:threonine--tRNA ligase [Leptospiraceae bacterium]MDW8305684.1 threonine--tRNA ligase [Leptospiraceae bacterium]